MTTNIDIDINIICSYRYQYRYFRLSCKACNATQSIINHGVVLPNGSENVAKLKLKPIKRTREMTLCISKIIPGRRRGKEKIKAQVLPCNAIEFYSLSYFTQLNPSNIMDLLFTTHEVTVHVSSNAI